MMKRSLLISSLLLSSLLFTTAATRAQDAATPHRFSIGPAVTVGGCIYAGTIPDGYKTSAGLAWDAGAQMYYIVNENFGVELGLVYDQRSLNIHLQNDATTATDYTLNYIAFRPGITIKDFTLGLGIGLPQSSSAVSKVAGTAGPTTTVGASDISTFIEIRLGANIPLIESPSGSLRFLINASYPLGNTFTSANFANKDDGPIPALKAGFTYQFSVGGN